MGQILLPVVTLYSVFTLLNLNNNARIENRYVKEAL